MIIIGYASSKKGEEYRLDFLKNGQEVIKQFPLLYSILKDFPDFDIKKYDGNYFLLLASKSKGGTPSRSHNISMYNKIKEYEVLLNEIGFLNLKSKKRRDIAKKMNSFNTQQNHSISKELEFFKQLKTHKEIRGVVYDDFEHSNHDFRILVGNTYFNLEFTSISTSKPSKILEDSFFSVAETLIKDIPDRKYLKIEVDPYFLLNDAGKMEEPYICSLIIKKTKEILPIIYAKEDGHCRVESRMGEPNKSFYEFREYYEHYGDWGDRLKTLLQTEEGKKFLRGTSFDSLGKFPISSFCYSPSNFKLVEIHSKSQWPSLSEEGRKRALLKQLKRSITSKIKKGQLKGQENPIIVFQFQDVLFHEYLNANDPFGPGQLQELEEQIVKAFIENNESKIIGVLIIQDFLISSRLILNPNFNINDKVLSEMIKFTKINS